MPKDGCKQANVILAAACLWPSPSRPQSWCRSGGAAGGGGDDDGSSGGQKPAAKKKAQEPASTKGFGSPKK